MAEGAIAPPPPPYFCQILPTASRKQKQEFLPIVPGEQVHL